MIDNLNLKTMVKTSATLSFSFPRHLDILFLDFPQAVNVPDLLVQLLQRRGGSQDLQKHF